MRRLRLDERGAVLAQVLMLSILMAMLAANLMKMTMHRAQSAQNIAGGASGMGTTEGAFGALQTVFRINGTCVSGSTGGGGVGVVCAGPSGACNACLCTFTPAPPYTGVTACVRATGRVDMCAPKFPGDTCP